AISSWRLTDLEGSRTMDLEPITSLPIMSSLHIRACALAVALLLASGPFAPLAAQSLADVARQEEARRKAIKQPSKVITNKDLGDVPATTPPVETTPAPAAGAATPAEADKDKADKGKKENSASEKKDAEPPKDQAYWSGR